MNTKPSHWLSVNRGALALLWTLILALLQTGPALAFVQSTSSAGFPQGSTKVYPLRWDLSGYASGIPFVVKTDNLGDGTSDIPGAEEFPIIRSSFDVWTNVPTSKIKFNQAGVTAQIKVGQSDSVSSIGFREDSVLSKAGVLGMTFQVIGSNPSQPSLLGRITEADILLIDGPKTRWMKSGTNHYPSQPTVATQINLQEIVVREIGEACGLGVSFVRSDYSDPLVLVEDAAIVGDNRDKPFADTAIMYPFPLQDSPVWKNGLLSSDDVAGITTLYPEEAALGSTGSIKGVITMREASTKQVSPVAGAHVMAVDANTLQPQVGTVSDRDGSYEIKGLSAGDYLVWVEPSSPADLIDRLPDLGPENMEFWSEYYNNAYYSQTDKATIVSVAVGQTKGGIDVEVMKTIYDGERTLSAPNETDSEGNRVVLKVEPDNSQEDATLLEDTNGSGVIRVEDILAVDGDTDFYSIIAKRDDIYKVEVYAQRDGAALTPVISLYGPGPQAVPFETESQTPGLDGDAEVTFTAPENNRYFIEISDLNDQGGGLYFYTLVITKLSQRIPIFPTQGPTPVLGIPISDFDLHNAGLTDPEIFGNVEITKLRVQFWDVDGDGGLNSDGSDFLPPTAEVGAGETALESGFALFNDDGNSPGVFDFDPSSLDFAEQDNSIRMAVSPVISPISNGFEVTFTPDSPLVIPAQNVQDSSADVWVVIQPSLNLHHGDDFQVFIPANGIELRVNTEAGPQTVNLFNENTPSIFERDLYTGDVISLTSFIPLAGSLIDANSTDFPVVGINLIGDPNEQYWVSKVEVTFVGFNLINIVEFAPGFNAPWGGLSFFRYPDENIRRAWEMTDLMPLTNGTDKSGGVNLYFDNDSLGSTGDGAPNFGLDGDHLLELDGTQRFEVVDLEEIPTQILEDLILHALLDFTSIDQVLEHRDEVGLFAFKAVLPLKPNPILAFPSTDRSEDSTFGPDMFVSMRTSNLVEALDVFIPFMTVDSVEIKNDLDTVLARGPEFSSLVNGSSYRSIDPRTQPNTTVVEVRPKPSFTLKDLVSPSDLSNRGNTLGTSEEGAAPLAPIGIDANDYRQGALTTMNSDGYSGRDILNTGIILDSIEVILDPVENVDAIDRQYILNVIPDDGDETLGLLNLFSSPDPNLLDFPSRGLEIMVDDDTPEGNFSDDDGDGLADEELVNDSDDDVDGQTDEDDFGDEDAVGLNGQLDPNDDVIAFLQRNDFLPATSFAGYVANPIVQELPNGSLSVNYTNLTSQVTEVRTAGALVNDPLSIFVDAVFFRVDHPVITDEPGVPTADPGEVVDVYPNGVLVDFGDTLQPLFEAGQCTVSYFYKTQIPNSNRISALEGSDFFVSLRMGPASTAGDAFRARIPADGIGYSTYRDPQPVEQNLIPGTYPPSDFSTYQMRVGSTNVPPTLSFVRPATTQEARAVVVDEPQFPGGPDVERIEYEFEVSFLFDDPDNSAAVDFYYDNNNFGVDGKPIPFVDGQTTTNILDNDGDSNLTFVFRFPGELLTNPNAEVFIYGIVDDGINSPRPVYSNGAIILPEEERDRFKTEEFYLFDNIGNVFGSGIANINIPDYRQPFNDIRDVELTPNDRGALFLKANGQVALKGDPDPWRDYVRTSNIVNFGQGSVNFGMDIARDLEPDFFRNGMYILDGFGGITALGNVPPDSLDLAEGPLFGMDIARDMELTPTGEGLLILDGLGPTHPLGDAPAPGGQPYFGFDIARALALTPSGQGFYILDGYGGIFALGDARPIGNESGDLNRDDIPYMFPGSDIYRDIEVVPGNRGVLVLDRAGQVYSSSGVLTGPQVIQAGVIPPPPGFRTGELIDFRKLGANSNVVVSEFGGAFVDLETIGTGFEFTSPGGTGSGGGDLLDALCYYITTENLESLISLYSDNFEDAQGHDKRELTENWKSFFDYFKVNGCRIPNASLSISVDPQVQNGFIINGSMEIFTLNPSIQVVGPADDPTELEDPGTDNEEGAGEIFTIGPIEFDQLVSFYEIGDGRGWHMNIWDDDHVEGNIDEADRLLVQRDFYKTRYDREREGQGTVFLREEDSGDSRNSEYLVQFTEEIEAPITNPEGGWRQPVVVFQLFLEDEDNNVPSSIFRFPFNLKVKITDLATQRAEITGGEFATWGFLVSRTDADALQDTQIGQSDSIDELLISAAGFRFFDPVGIQADPAFQHTYLTHLFEEEGFFVTDPISSAYVVDLVQSASDLLDLGETGLALYLNSIFDDPSLDIPPNIIEELVPYFAFNEQTTSDVAFLRGFYLVTFRGDEFGDPDKLYYAVFQVMEGFPHVDVDEPDNNNTPSSNKIFRWRFDPETQFIPFSTFKKIVKDKE